MTPMCSGRELDNRFALVPLSGADEESNTDQETAMAHVPFDFVVGEILLPAGAYDLMHTEIPGMLALHKNGCAYPSALVQEIRSERDTAKLLFYRHENLYFLAQVLAGEN
jgi:hypothetical protein